MHLSHGFSLSLSNIIQIFVCDRHMGEIVTCDMLRVRLHHTDWSWDMTRYRLSVAGGAGASMRTIGHQARAPPAVMSTIYTQNILGIFTCFLLVPGFCPSTSASKYPYSFFAHNLGWSCDVLDIVWVDFRLKMFIYMFVFKWNCHKKDKNTAVQWGILTRLIVDRA